MNSLLAQDWEGRYEGRIHVFVFPEPGPYWSYSGEIQPHYVGDRCPTTRMTRRRVGENTWVHASDTPIEYWENPSMAVNHDGSWLAVIENYGVHGALSVFRRENYQWIRDSQFVPAPEESEAWGQFIISLDFSRHADYLALGNPMSKATGRGVMLNAPGYGTRDGSVTLFKRNPQGNPQWSVSRVIKAPNPEEGDNFGTSVAFGGAGGRYLAVGAPSEDSAATGVDGNQLDDSATGAGAVYLY